jgi:hypothetical protein
MTLAYCENIQPLPTEERYMSKPQTERSGEPRIFLKRRHGWFQRVLGIPENPANGDRGRVRDVLLEVIGAAGGLEFSRGELLRLIGVAQEEYSSHHRTMGEILSGNFWGGAATPAVYYAFFEAAV